MIFFFISRTKIFIRFPKTLFATEDAFEFSKHQLGMFFSSALIFLNLFIMFGCAGSSLLHVGFL